MNHESQPLVTETRLWLRQASRHGFRGDGNGQSFDEAAPTPARPVSPPASSWPPSWGATNLSATRRGSANTARTPIIEPAIGRRGDELDFYVDTIQVLDPEGRIVPRRPTPEAGGEWESITTPGVEHQEVMQSQDFPTTGLRQ